MTELKYHSPDELELHAIGQGNDCQFCWPTLSNRQEELVQERVRDAVDLAEGESWERGHSTGHDEGYIEGHEAGKDLGYTAGLARGQKEGYSEGYEAGYNTAVAERDMQAG